MLGRAVPGACWRSRAFECRAYRQSGTAEIDRRRPKMQPTFFRSSTRAAGKLRFNVLPTDTSVSLGANISSTDEKWLPSLSAEQKLFRGPFNVTRSVSQ